MENNKNQNCLTKEETSALLTACNEGDYNLVKFLLEKCSVNLEETFADEENAALHIAVSRGDLRMVELLLSHGAQVNAATKTNRTTPLHLACEANNLDMVKFLITQKGDIEATNWCGLTCLMIASKTGNMQLVNYLLSANADVHKKTFSDGNTALHGCGEATFPSNYHIFTTLVQHGASVNQENIYGVTPAVHAATKGQGELITSLINTGLLPRKQVIETFEVLGAFLMLKHSDMIKALLFWFPALMEREIEPAIPKERKVVSMYSYGERDEFRDNREVIECSDSRREMSFQAILVLERILGPAHPFTTSSLMEIFNGLTRVELGLHALHVQQEYLQPLDHNIKTTFRMLTKILCEEGEFVREELLLVFSKAVKQLSVGKKYLQEHKSNFYQRELSELLGTTLYIASILVKSFVAIEIKDVDFSKRFHDILRTLVDLDLRVDLNRSPLHLVNNKQKNEEFPWSKLPCEYLSRELVKVGANPNVRDEHGNTPLHLAAMMRCPKNSLRLIGALSNVGAHLCVGNRNGETFMDLLKDFECRDLRTVFNSAKYMTLACSATRVIKKHKIPLEACLPAHVIEFVNNH